jgi:hypothetical protein
MALSSRIVPHPHDGELNGQVDDTTSRAGYARFQRTGCNLQERPAAVGRLKRKPLLRNRHAQLLRGSQYLVVRPRRRQDRNKSDNRQGLLGQSNGVAHLAAAKQ